MNQGVEIAKKDLRDCYGELGILAGSHQFAEYWLRDSMWASWGALELGDVDIVKKSLELWLAKIDMNGMTPLRIDKKSLKPVYRFHDAYFWGTSRSGKNSFPKDSNSLVVIMAGEYFKKTGDRSWLNRIWPKLETLMKWYEQFEIGGLIFESWHEGWMDSLRTEGFLAYTNVCYVKALRSMMEISYAWKNKYQDTRIKMEQLLNKQNDIFVVDGNMLAVWWGLVSDTTGRGIIDRFRKLNMDKPVPCKTNSPSYNSKVVAMRYKILGISGYHNNDCAWLWLGAVSAMATRKFDKQYSEDLMQKIDQTVVEWGTVYEIYDRWGKPVRSWLYKSEHPFAWSAGMITKCEYEINDLLTS